MAGSWERSEVRGASRRQGGWWVMPAPRAQGIGTGTGTSQPRAPRLLPASWAGVQRPTTHLPGGGLLAFSSVSSEDSLRKGKVKPAACTLTPPNSKGKHCHLPPPLYVLRGSGHQLPGSWGRAQTPMSTRGFFFSCLFCCGCPQMT